MIKFFKIIITIIIKNKVDVMLDLDVNVMLIRFMLDFLTACGSITQ